MAILRGDEARRYIAGGGTYRMPGQPSWVQGEGKPKRGFLGKIAAGIIDPFVDLAQMAGEGVGETFHMMRGGKIRDYKPIFMKESERRELREDPLLEMSKRYAGAVATALPGAGAGASLGKMAGVGALTGGLGGYGASEAEDIEGILGDVGTGALTGGVIGGATYGIGKGLEKLKTSNLKEKAVEKLRGFERSRELNNIKRAMKRAPIKGEGGVKLLDDIIDESRSYKAVVNSPDDLFVLSDAIQGKYGSVVKEGLDDAATKGITIDADAIMKKVDEIVDNPRIPAAKKIQYERARDYIREDLKEIAGSPATGYLKKQGWGALGDWDIKFDPNIQGSSDVYEEAYKAISDQFEDILGSANYREANEMLAKSINMKKYATRAGSQYVPSGSWNDPLQDAFMAGGAAAGGPGALGGYLASKWAQSRGFEQMLGKGAGKLADILEGTGTPSKLGKILGSSAMGKIGQLGVSKAPLLGTLATTGKSSLGVPQPKYQEGGLPTGIGAGAGTGIGMGSPAASRAIALQLLGQGMSPNEVSTTMQLLGIGGGGGTGAGGGELTEQGKKFALAGMQAQGALDLLEQGVSTGKLAELGGGIARFFGKESPERSAYRSQLAMARTAVRNAMLGAAMSEQEMQSISGFIPEYTDEPEVAANKLRSFIQAMNQYSQL